MNPRTLGKMEKLIHFGFKVLTFYSNDPIGREGSHRMSVNTLSRLPPLLPLKYFFIFSIESSALSRTMVKARFANIQSIFYMILA